MAAGGRRNRADHLLIAALLKGEPLEVAASRAGVSPRSAYRRQNDADFQVALSHARSRALGRAVTALCGKALTVVQELGRLCEEGQAESTRLGACRVALEQAFRGAEIADLESRITALEQQAPAPSPNGRGTYTPEAAWP